jgi:glutathione S-transferase
MIAHDPRRTIDSPFVRRVAVTLHHYHMPFERNALSVFQNAKAMQKINPLVRVPALVLESGEVLIDSAAIVDHLDEVAGPARALTPAHGPERRKVLKAAAMASGIVDKAGAVVYERYWHQPRMVSEDWLHRCLDQAKHGLEYLEQQCGAPWFIDSRMTQADVMIGCMLGYLSCACRISSRPGNIRTCMRCRPIARCARFRQARVSRRGHAKE